MESSTALSLTSQTTSLLEQKSSSAKRVLATSPMKPSTALEAAKKLTGQWPHARPPNVEMWLSSIASVLAQYPSAIVQECIDPRCGLAREREFPPTIAVIVEWCDKRMAHHRLYAEYQFHPLPTPRPPVSEQERAIASYALRKLFDWMRGAKDTRGDPPTWDEAARELAAQKQAAE